MSNEILDEVYAARERLWQRAGGTMRGLGEYLMECRRRAEARGVLWIESAEEREAIGAEVRARLAREAGGAMCVGEGKGVLYRAEEAHTEARRDGDTEGGSTKGHKGGMGVADGAATGGTRMAGENGPTILQCNDSTTPIHEVTR